jgi:hypothetical protein
MNLSTLISNYEPQGSPFGTHLNLLRSLGRDIRSVLELGAGEFSTRLFLDKTYYPNLNELVTVEQRVSWVVADMDDRHRVIIEPEPIEPLLIGVLDMEDFDLIFCDNSTSGERRCETLRWLAKNVERSLVVAHDFDVPSYREACAGFDHFIVDDRQSPWTALMWRSR